MRNRLPKSVYKSVTATIERGAPLDPMVADRRGVRDERLGRVRNEGRWASVRQRRASRPRSGRWRVLLSGGNGCRHTASLGPCSRMSSARGGAGVGAGIGR
jgi:hypothetical protein